MFSVDNSVRESETLEFAGSVSVQVYQSKHYSFTEQELRCEIVNDLI